MEAIFVPGVFHKILSVIIMGKAICLAMCEANFLAVVHRYSMIDLGGAERILRICPRITQ
jgi:hypothetical protein